MHSYNNLTCLLVPTETYKQVDNIEAETVRTTIELRGQSVV